VARIQIAPEIGGDFDWIFDHLAQNDIARAGDRIGEIIQAFNVLEANPSSAGRRREATWPFIGSREIGRGVCACRALPEGTRMQAEVVAGRMQEMRPELPVARCRGRRAFGQITKNCGVAGLYSVPATQGERSAPSCGRGFAGRADCLRCPDRRLVHAVLSREDTFVASAAPRLNSQ
jgi:plasmid stabilization system protein ParE